MTTENKRKHKRYIKHCKTEFSVDNKIWRGISKDFSLTGLFIKSKHHLPPNTEVDIKVHSPDGGYAVLRGKVRRVMKASKGPARSTSGKDGEKSVRGLMKDGMGIEILHRDANYLRLMSSMLNDRKSGKGPSKHGESQRDVLLNILFNQQALINLLEKNKLIDKKDLISEIKKIRDSGD